MRKSAFYGGIGFILITALVACKSTKNETVIEEVITENVVTDTVTDTKLYSETVIDSLMAIELKQFNNIQELNEEIAKLLKASDSINQSNVNLRNYIKHQDKMIKK